MASNSSALVVGDDYFGNLRPLRHLSERVCFFTSLAANAVLAVLLIREKNEVKPYSRVLLINVAFDVLYTVICMLVETEFEINDGVYIFVINGVLAEYSEPVRKLALTAWTSSLNCTFVVSPIEFIFRYFLVVRNTALSHWQLTLITCVVCLSSSVIGICTYLGISSVPDHDASFGSLMNHEMWHPEGESLVFYAMDKSNVYLIAFVLWASVLITVITAILAFTTMAILARFREQREQMSTKARYMQRQLNRIMFAEVTSLVSVACIPLGIVIIVLFLDVQFVGLGVLLTLMVQWIPGVNPIITIFLVGPYRKRLFGFCAGRVSSGAVVSTGSTNASAG